MKVTLDLFGESRTVEVRTVETHPKLSNVGTVLGFVGTIGAGSARYPTSLMMWRVTDERPAYRGNRTVTADDGSVWQFNLNTVIRNRNNARIVGWADVAGATNDHDQTRR